MYPNNFFMPGYGMGLGAMRTPGMLGKAGGIFSSIKGINWSGLLGNASKALGVVNQAVPLVKQVGPMFNNMKSMIKLAGAFKDETDSPKIKKATQPTPQSNNNNNIAENKSSKQNTDNSNYYYNTPNFFL